MAYFMVNYQYVGDADQMAAIRPTHRDWLSAQLAAGNLLASGPLVDLPGALLIFKSESLVSLSQLLDEDPFDIAGLIGERDIAEWNPVFGPWSNS
jgi:uncharacterized protein YciI